MTQEEREVLDRPARSSRVLAESAGGRGPAVHLDAARGDHARYTRVAIVLHWSIAGLIIFNLLGMIYLGEEAPPGWHKALIPVHVSAGITILALTAVRIVWRLLHAPPPYSSHMPPWERGLAHLAHFALYAAMILMPLTGWAVISAHPPLDSPGAAYVAAVKEGPNPPPGLRTPVPVSLWWAVDLPMIGPLERLGTTPEGVLPQYALHKDFIRYHAVGGYLTLALLLLHIAGALKHQFWDKENEFDRMSLRRRSKEV